MTKKPATVTMDELLETSKQSQLKEGETVEGTVMSVKKHEVWLDLGPNGIGLVIRREIGFSNEVAEGSVVMASVIDPELEEGYPLLSLRKAAKERGWDVLQEVFDKGNTIDISPYDANRGGLLMEMEGIR